LRRIRNRPINLYFLGFLADVFARNPWPREVFARFDSARSIVIPSLWDIFELIGQAASQVLSLAKYQGSNVINSLTDDKLASLSTTFKRRIAADVPLLRFGASKSAK
jgi:hypothetical protein